MLRPEVLVVELSDLLRGGAVSEACEPASRQHAVPKLVERSHDGVKLARLAGYLQINRALR